MKRPEITEMRVTFAAPPEHWSNERDRMNRERIATGYTSLRVSRQTAKRVHELTRQVADALGWSPYRRKLSPDELLGLIGSGVLQVRTHAKPDRTMHARPRDLGTVHANSDVGPCMHSGDRENACMAPAVDPLQLSIPGA